MAPEAFGAEAFDRFQAEPDTLVIAVVDADGRPVGLIERNAFTLKMAAEFGRALYARRPASSLMSERPRILDAQALRAWAHGLGVDTFVGTSGRVFPTEMKAAPLLRAWLARLRASGVR